MPAPDGLLLIDKPAGLTSFQTVAIARGALRAARGGAQPRVGHTGTLDPLATGLLVLLVGSATRLSPFLTHLPKSYRWRARFGIGTDSLDADGVVSARSAVTARPEDLAGVLPRHCGVIEQVPPIYSALKRGGQRLHRLARAGREVPEPAARRVTISRLELEAVRWGEPPAPGEDAALLAPDGLVYEAELSVDCSGGTYVRSLTRDLAAAIGTLAHVRSLRRHRVGPFVVDEAMAPERLRDGAALGAALRPLSEGLPHLPAVCLGRQEALAVRRGAAPEPAWLARLDGPPVADPRHDRDCFRLVDEAGALVAVAACPPGSSQPRLLAVFAAREGGDAP